MYRTRLSHVVLLLHVTEDETLSPDDPFTFLMFEFVKYFTCLAAAAAVVVVVVVLSVSYCQQIPVLCSSLSSTLVDRVHTAAILVKRNLKTNKSSFTVRMTSF